MPLMTRGDIQSWIRYHQSLLEEERRKASPDTQRVSKYGIMIARLQDFMQRLENYREERSRKEASALAARARQARLQAAYERARYRAESARDKRARLQGSQSPLEQVLIGLGLSQSRAQVSYPARHRRMRPRTRVVYRPVVRLF